MKTTEDQRTATRSLAHDPFVLALLDDIDELLLALTNEQDARATLVDAMAAMMRGATPRAGG